MDMELGSDGRSQFGIRRILDCNISEDGQQMYQVEWETTWEPAKSFTACQNLLDDFWSLINKAKSRERVALCQRNLLSSPALGTNSFAKVKTLSEEDKDQVHRLIQRTSQTPTGRTNVLTPSELFMSVNRPSLSPCNQMTNINTGPVKTNELKHENVPKNNKCSTASDGLKYIANFSNPYVKLIVVCKVCNKEQSLKHSYHWATHFKVHDKSLCHTCPYCPKTFRWPSTMRKHVEAEHPEYKSEN